MKFADIQPFTQPANYKVNIGWSFLEESLQHYAEKTNKNFVFDMDPDFQRAHVWTEEQQRRYVEFILRQGQSSRDIYWNCPGWMDGFKGPMQLVDGKQRVEAARRFMRNDLAIFGGYKLNDFTDKPRFTDAGFVFHINNLKSRTQVLQWYLDLNDGGVIHTKEEIVKVRKMLEAEKSI